MAAVPRGAQPVTFSGKGAELTEEGRGESSKGQWGRSNNTRSKGQGGRSNKQQGRGPHAARCRGAVAVTAAAGAPAATALHLRGPPPSLSPVPPAAPRASCLAAPPGPTGGGWNRRGGGAGALQEGRGVLQRGVRQRCVRVPSPTSSPSPCRQGGGGSSRRHARAPPQLAATERPSLPPCPAPFPAPALPHAPAPLPPQLTAKELAASSHPLLWPRHRQQPWPAAASDATISARWPRVCPSSAAVVYRLPCSRRGRQPGGRGGGGWWGACRGDAARSTEQESRWSGGQARGLRAQTKRARGGTHQGVRVCLRKLGEVGKQGAAPRPSRQEAAPTQRRDPPGSVRLPVPARAWPAA